MGDETKFLSYRVDSIKQRIMTDCTTPYGENGLPIDNVKDVLPYDFIKAFAEHLQKEGKFVVPSYMEYVKTAHYKELAPMRDDFIFTRAAAIFRVLLVHPERQWGVGRLAKKFGGKKRAKGASRSHKKPAAQGIIRHCVKELTRLGYLQADEHGIRTFSSKGLRDATTIAKQCGAQ